MKKIVHYLILTLVLIGIPVLTAGLFGNEEIWKGLLNFPPRTEDWGLDPAKSWNVRYPFSWWVFVPLVVCVVAVCAPFVRRSVRAALTSKGVRPVARFPWWGRLGLVMFLGWLPVVWLHPAWAAKLQVHSFAIMGFGHAFLMDALTYRRTGRTIFRDAPKAFLILLPASALFWWFFEILNRFSWNWFFVGLEDYTAFEYVCCFSLGCATILPSVVTTARWLGTFACFSDGVCSGMVKADVRSPWSVAVGVSVTLIGLVGVVLVPVVTFPFLWLSPIFASLLLQVAFGGGTVLDPLRSGNWSLPWRFAVAMLICGFIWETWGFWIPVRWTYTVPYLYKFCYAEMPVIGFSGYLPFGIEAAIVCHWISPRLVGLVRNGDGLVRKS